MRFLDWAVVVAYLAYVIWDGIRMTKNSGSAEGYFLANRSLPWWAVGLSVMATQMSAITLVGAAGQAYWSGGGTLGPALTFGHIADNRPLPNVPGNPNPYTIYLSGVTGVDSITGRNGAAEAAAGLSPPASQTNSGV